MNHSIIRRIHNPHNRTCGCASDCWCQTSAVGRAVRWWFPGRLVGLHHKGRGDADWKRAQHSN
jgi:hypothetical protein